MSSVNAPQPDATGPAEVFDSTAAAPHGATISAIGVPAGPPQETPSHTGMFNTYDVKLHEQFVPIDVITWSVVSTAGSLLWKRPIHPRFCHPVISLFSQAYNTWSGGLDFNFKVAGTGFHAGAIAIVRIPPNLDPADFQSPTSWGLFEYCVIDPKTLEVESLGVSDQRPIMYHYMKFDQANPNTFGGWIAMYVLIPLNTSSTGSQQIQIQAFTRPGQTFQFSQLIIPGIVDESPIFPECFNQYFDFEEYDTLATFPARASHILIEPSGTTTTQAVMNCFKLDGEPMSKYCKKTDREFPPCCGQFQVAAYGDGIRPATDNTYFDWKDYKKPLGLPVKGIESVFIDTQNTGENESFKSADREWSADATAKSVTWHYKTAATTLKTSDGFGYIILSATMPPTFTDNTYGAASNNESILHFASRGSPLTTWNLYGAQTGRLAELFKKNVLYDLLPSGMCFLFLLTEKEDGLPLGYVKLYPNGVFTAKASEKQTIIDLSKCKLTFYSYILRTEQIPQNVTYQANRRLISEDHYRNFARV